MSTKPAEVLFTPYTLGDLQLKNRIVMAPLTRARAENQGKIPSETPRQMSLHDIKQAVKDFRHAAQVARDAGFDGVQIQGGFVYLFQQFLHEVTNRRTDEYGGPVENRARILFEALSTWKKICSQRWF